MPRRPPDGIAEMRGLAADIRGQGALAQEFRPSFVGHAGRICAMPYLPVSMSEVAGTMTAGFYWAGARAAAAAGPRREEAAP